MRHVLAYYGLDDGRIRVVCQEPGCTRPNGQQWAATFDPGHTTDDWRRLDRMHSGTIHTGPTPDPELITGRMEPRHYPVRTTERSHDDGEHRPASQADTA